PAVPSAPAAAKYSTIWPAGAGTIASVPSRSWRAPALRSAATASSNPIASASIRASRRSLRSCKGRFPPSASIDPESTTPPHGAALFRQAGVERPCHRVSREELRLSLFLEFAIEQHIEPD